MNTFFTETLSNYVSPQANNLVLFHGYGADANDLYSLSDMISTSHPTNWYFPNGPISIPLGGAWMGRAWWPINPDRFQGDLSKLDISNEVPSNLDQLTLDFVHWFNDNKDQAQENIIGGFSQGGMLALNIFLKHPNLFSKLVLLSTNLINRPGLKNLDIVAAKDKRIFISHGEHDTVLPINAARRMEKFLVEKGLVVQSNYFQGGHEIPKSVLYDLNHFINS